jgi:hypothetical protein
MFYEIPLRPSDQDTPERSDSQSGTTNDHRIKKSDRKSSARIGGFKKHKHLLHRKTQPNHPPKHSLPDTANNMLCPMLGVSEKPT